MKRLVVIASSGLTLLMVCCLLQQDNTTAQFEEYLSAGSARDARFIIEDKLKNFRNEDVSSNWHHASDRVSLRMAWESLIRKNLDRIHSDFNPKTTGEFFGFIEGRLRITLPSFVKDSEPRIGAHGNTYFLSSNDKRSTGLANEKQASPEVEVLRVSERVKVKFQDRIIFDSSYDDLGVVYRKSDFVVGEETIVVRFFDVHPSEQLMVCWTKDGEKLWSENVWVSGKHQAYSGMGGQDTAMTISGNEIIVFGISTCLYIEKFDLQTGRPTLRFSTDY